MKKRNLFLAGALLLGFGLNAQAQTAEETLFFYGFEDELASFMDSTNPLDSITEIRYYEGEGSSAPTSYEVVYVKDSTMLMFNAVSPLKSRGDSFELIQDPLGGHQADMEAMGAQGGNYFFKYTAGGEGSDLCNDYEANLFVRGIKFEPFTSYRLVFYTKASDRTAQIGAGIFRGYYNSEYPISMNGSSGNEFFLTKTEFTTDNWERNTLMIFYQNDSVANRHMWNTGYWWAGAWSTVDPETGNTYQKIEQFDKFFLRMSFRYPGRTYYLDDISLYKSTIGGAEFNGDILRVNFGYETNLGAIAKADPAGAVELPGDYFTLTAEYGGAPYELDVMSAEYHDDGYLYIWLADDSFEGLENVRLSLKNPEDPALQLKYTGSLYPNSLDEEWVNAGKIVPDFENEFAVYNPSVFATSLKFYPPVVMSVSPEEGSFGLSGNTDKVDVTFSKEIYANLSKPLDDESSVLLNLQTEKGVENWIPVAYDEETFTVTFQRPSNNSGELKGDYDFTLINAHADKGAQYMRGDDYTFSYSFGPADIAPIYMGKSDFSKYNVGDREIEGFSTSEYGMMRIQQFSGLGGKAIMWGLFGENLQNDPKGSDDTTRGPALMFKVNVSEAGEWRVSWATSGCKKDSWNDGAIMWFRIYDADGNAIYEVNKGEDHVNLPEEGGVVTTYETFQEMIEFPTTGEYTLVWNLPVENSWGGGHKGGRVLYYVEVSNEYSSAYKYIEMLLGAQASAKALLEDAKADKIYSGEYLDDFGAVIDEYEGFTSTAPSAYNNAVKALTDATAEMSGRMALVDKFYTEYAAAEAKEAVYTDSVGYNQLAAYDNLVAKIAEYKDLDVTKKNNEALTAIIDEVTAAIKGMTDRCAAMDMFNGLIADLENLFVTYAAYDFAAEFKNAQDAYNENKDADLITISEDDLTTANNAMDAAKTAFDSKMAAAGLLTKQNKDLKAIAADLDIEMDPAVEKDMNSILDDRQDLANIYQLAIKAKLSEMMGNDELEDEMDMTAFIQNASFYNVFSPNAVISANQDPLPGWTVIKGSGNNYLSAWGNDRAQTEGAVKNIDIALDWNSSIKMTQTVKNLPAGVYTIAHTAGAWGDLTPSTTGGAGLVILQKDENDEIIASDTLALHNSDHSMQFNALGGEIEILLDWATTTTWAFLDNITLTLDEPLAGHDYAADATEAAVALEEATGVAVVMKAADVRYYNLNGVRTAQPDGISIKVTTGKNGARKVEKILAK